MKKKLIITLILIITILMFGQVAFADTCPNDGCTLVYRQYHSEGTTQHRVNCQYCPVCGQYYGGSFENHTLQFSPIDGSKHKKSCKKCEYWANENHSGTIIRYNQTSTQHTAVYKCNSCGKEYLGNAKNHSWTTLSSTPATCTTKGSVNKKCSVCGKTVTEETPALGHDYTTSEVTTPATCTTPGVRTWYCSRDNSHTYTETIPAGAHVYGAWETVSDGTCVTGEIQRRTCSVCGNIETQEGSTNPLNHEGPFTYSYDQYTSTQHKVTETCQACSEEADSYYRNHDWSEWQIDTPSTCISAGEKSRECSKCGETETATIPYSGHVTSNWQHDDNQHWKTCTVCGTYLYAKENHADTADGNGYYDGNCDAGCGYHLGVNIATQCTITLSQSSFVYDGTDKEPTVTVMNGNQNATFNVSYTNNRNAGEATVTITGTGSNPRYYGTTTRTFLITKAPRTGTNKPTVSMSDYQYEGVVATPSVANNKENGTVTYYYTTTNTTSGGTDFSAVTNTTLNAGNYYMYATIGATDNYQSGTTDATAFQVTKHTAVCPALVDKEYDYDGNAHTVETGAGLHGGTVRYSDDMTNWSTTLPTKVDVGAYSIYAKVIGDANHYDSAIEQATLRIKPGSISGKTLTINPPTYEYDGTEKEPTVTVAGLASTDYEVSYSNNVHVGNNTAVVTVTGKGNYTGTLTGNFSITTATITMTGPSNTYRYGQTIPNYTLSDFTITGVKNNEPVNITGTYHCVAEAGSPIGTYPVEKGTFALASATGFEATDYTFTYVNGLVTITEAQIADLVVELPPYQFTYDGTPQEFEEVNVLDPLNSSIEFVNGTDYTLTYNNNTHAGENTATVTITFSGNYSGTVTKNFSIGRRVINVIPNNVEKFFGESDPPLSYTYTNYIEEPKFSGAISRTPGESIGSYEILKNTLELKSEAPFDATNYKMEFSTGKTLTIKKRDLSDYTATLNPTVYTFDGTYKTPDTTVTKPGGGTLVKDTDYYVTYLNNFNAGTAKAIITGINGYEGSQELSFTINKANITGSVNVVSTGTGGPSVGDILSAEVTVNPTDASLTYQWYTSTTNTVTDGTAIEGATSDHITLSNSELGKYIYVIVHASKEPNYNSINLSKNIGQQVSEMTPPTAPVITAKLNNSTGANYTSGTWVNENVWLSVISEDNSTISRYEYSTTSSTSGYSTMTTLGDGSANILVNANSNNVIYYFRAIDMYENISSVASIVVCIDKDKPVIGEATQDVTTWTNQPVIVTVNATDALSGINGYYFGTSATPTFTEIGAVHETTQTKQFTENASNYFVVKDKAGNEERIQFTVGNIDTTAPNLLVEAERESSKITLVISSSDSQSGVEKITINGEEVTLSEGTVKTCEYEILDGGTYKVVSKDVAGNESQYELVVYAVRYSGNGLAGSMSSQLKLAGESVTIKDNGFTSSDYEFLNWNTDKNGSGDVYEPGDTYDEDESVTLFAQIREIELSFDRVVLEAYEYPYTGEAIYPVARVYNNYGKLLQEEEDYIVSYEDNINVGIGKVKIIGAGRYLGDELNTTFKIVGNSIANVTIDLDPNIFVYDGFAKTPKVTVSKDLITLVNGKDYILTYEDNVNAGTAKAIITGRGNYYGTKEAEFAIIKADRNLKTYNVAMVVGDTVEIDYSYEGERVADTLVEPNNTGKVSITSNDTRFFVRANAAGTTTIKYTVPESENYNSAEELLQVTIYSEKEEAYPIYGTVLINDGAEQTNNNRTVLTIRAECAEYMYISESATKPANDAEGWVDYSTKMPHEFPDVEGTFKIYVWFKDINGNVTDAATDTIFYDKDYNEAAHDSILLDKTPVNTAQPEVEYVSLLPEESTGITVELKFMQQDPLINGTRSGVNNTTIRYGYKEKDAEGDYTWSENNRLSNLGFSKNYVIVTKANDRADNGVTISDEYEIVTPSKYTTIIKLTETFIQTDGLTHEILPATFEKYGGNEPSGTITYTYYTDRECQHKTTSADGANYEGGAPSKPKTYYVKVSLTNDPNYHDAISEVGKLHIGWYISTEKEKIFSYVEETATGSGKYDLNVFGSGNMKDLSAIIAQNSNQSLSYWVDFRNDIINLKLGNAESAITSIGAEVFSELPYITEITIPATVQAIGDYAFKGDIRVTNSINIPGTVTTIGINPFAEVMTPSFTISHGNTDYDVKDGVLVSIDHTELVSYPAGSTSTTYSIPDTVKEIAPSAFYGTANLTDVKIPNGVTKIKAKAFYDCPNLERVEIFDLSRNEDKHQDLVQVDDDAFMNIKENSEIYTFSGDIANMLEKDRDYDKDKTTVYWPPVINLHPVDMNGAVGGTVKFIVDAEPGYTDGINYQWYRQVGDTANIEEDVKLNVGSGFTTKEYTTSTLTNSNNNELYYCVVWNMPYYRDLGYAYSNPGKVIILSDANYAVERTIAEYSTSNTYYFTRLNDAFSFAQSGDNIRVLQNVSNEPKAVLDGNKGITFTNDNKNIEVEEIIEIAKGSSITMTGAGNITKDQAEEYIIENNGTLTISNAGLTLENVDGYGIETKTGSTLNIVNGTITAKTNTIYADSQPIKNTSDNSTTVNITTVNITGADAHVIATSNEDTDTIAIYANNYTKVNVENGSVEALNNHVTTKKCTAIYNNAKDDRNDHKGRVTISGGEVRASGYGYDTGTAVQNVSSADCVVTGGEIYGTHSAIVSDETSKFADIDIQGGEISAAYIAVINNSQSAKVIVGVPGGEVADDAPEIFGVKLAILNASKNDTMEFYDGILKTNIEGNHIYSPIEGTNGVIVYETIANTDLVIDHSITDKIYTQSGRNAIITEPGYSIYTWSEGNYNIATLKANSLPVPTTVGPQTVLEGEQAVFSFTIERPGDPDVYEFEWEVSKDGGSTWNKVTTGTGMNTSSYTTIPATFEMDKNMYRCKITSRAGVIYTNNGNGALLTVNEDIKNKNQKPTIRFIFMDEAWEVEGRQVYSVNRDERAVNVQIVVKSFEEMSSIKFTFDETKDLEIFERGGNSVIDAYDLTEKPEIVVQRTEDVKEYTYTYNLVAYVNGLITIKATNANGQEETGTQAIELIQDLRVICEDPSGLSNYNDRVLLTFVANRKVRPESSYEGTTEVNTYTLLESIDGNVYSNRFTYRPSGVMNATRFWFVDDLGNRAYCDVRAIYRTEYNDIKFNDDDTYEITDLNFIDAVETASELENQIELNDRQDAQSRYGLNKAQANIEMAKPREVGAVDLLSKATSSKSYDGIYIRDVAATQSANNGYDYVADDRNNYVAAQANTITELSDNYELDVIDDSDAYKGADISDFDPRDERRPFMYIGTNKSATNITGDQIYDASFRAVIVENK